MAVIPLAALSPLLVLILLFIDELVGADPGHHRAQPRADFLDRMRDRARRRAPANFTTIGHRESMPMRNTAAKGSTRLKRKAAASDGDSAQASSRNESRTRFPWRRRAYLGAAPHATLPRRDNGLN